ncbi:MAG: thiamine biosynthesis protein ApbE [Crocinitomicaceae bacterium]|nr:thiamine biosynthesis protein ApbE [Crocinitomicaceae bacterium]
MTLVANQRNIYTAVTVVIAVFFYSCNSTPVIKQLTGKAQGTTYTIKYTGDAVVSPSEIDSVLESMDAEMNTWRADSRISKINNFDRTDTVYSFEDESKIWSVLWDMTWEINHHSNGAFDPTVMPLVDLWGFGLKNASNVDSARVDSVMEFVGFRTDLIDFGEVETDVSYLNRQIIKGDSRSRLDFNAIAQGYTVDMLYDLLDEKGIENILVELGGEVRCKGVNAEGVAWRIAVDKPIASSHVDREYQAIISVENASVCTSGNYRKFIEVNGIKRSHSIDPRTGYPVEHNLLSVTIKASNAAIADAYATACMVLGPEEGREFILDRIENAPQYNVGAFFIESTDSTESYKYWVSPGWEEMITLLD